MAIPQRKKSSAICDLSIGSARLTPKVSLNQRSKASTSAAKDVGGRVVSAGASRQAGIGPPEASRHAGACHRSRWSSRKEVTREWRFAAARKVPSACQATASRSSSRASRSGRAVAMPHGSVETTSLGSKRSWKWGSRKLGAKKESSCMASVQMSMRSASSICWGLSKISSRAPSPATRVVSALPRGTQMVRPARSSSVSTRMRRSPMMTVRELK